jgi:hypothetical protein
MQLRLVLIGAALLIAIFADLLALRIGQTEYRGQFPTKGHQVGHGRISAIDDFWVDNILIRIKMAASTPKMLLLLGGNRTKTLDCLSIGQYRRTADRFCMHARPGKPPVVTLHLEA